MNATSSTDSRPQPDGDDKVDGNVARAVSLAVNGAGGRMGRQLLAAIAERSDVKLTAATEAPGSDCLGIDAGVLGSGIGNGVVVTDAFPAAASASAFDVIVDFTSPSATMALLESLFADAVDDKGEGTGTGSGVGRGEATPSGIVVGTTGLTADDHARMVEISRQVPVVFAANYSVGVTLALDLLEQAARALDEDYDIEVIEAHHHHKVDAPSGTALAMGHALARGRGVELDDVALYAREGITGERERGSIGFATVRAGDIVGEHTVLFGGPGERIEITHRAHQRMTFARGAVRAAIWLARQGAGLYDMRDVLGLADGQSSSEPSPT